MSEIKLKKQEEAKFNLGFAMVSTGVQISRLLKTLGCTGLQDIYANSYDYNITINFKNKQVVDSVMPELSVCIKRTEFDITDTGQLGLFAEEIPENYKDAKVEISMATEAGVKTATTTISELENAKNNIESDLRVRNRKANKKFSKMQIN